MSRIFLDPFADYLHEVFNLRRLCVSEHRNHIIERLAIFLSSYDFLEHANSSTAFPFPVPASRVKPVQPQNIDAG
jgi:hypothetical protein